MTEPVHTIADIHRERVFEEHLVSCLVTEQGYVERECTAHYDPEAALPDQLPLSYELRIVSRDGTRTGHWTLSEMGTAPNSYNPSRFTFATHCAVFTHFDLLTQIANGDLSL
jgi:hypothetical protein